VKKEEEGKEVFSLEKLICLLRLCGGQTASSAASPGGVPGDKQPFGKYDPPITMYSTKTLGANFPFEEGDTVDKNPWLQYNRDEQG
jgi:hypothetical protein